MLQLSSPYIMLSFQLFKNIATTQKEAESKRVATIELHILISV